MANEHSFIKSVHRHLKNIAPEIYMWKIHADFTNGIPDCWYSNASDLWVEYKWCNKVPVKDSTIIDLTNSKKYLSQLQINWLKERHKEGRNVCVILGSPEGANILLGTDWRTPISPKTFRCNAITTKQVAFFLANFLSTQGRKQ